MKENRSEDGKFPDCGRSIDWIIDTTAYRSPFSPPSV